LTLGAPDPEHVIRDVGSQDRLRRLDLRTVQPDDVAHIVDEKTDYLAASSGRQ
jgi:hypothetical protein